jgi:hypothetical protein
LIGEVKLEMLPYPGHEAALMAMKEVSSLGITCNLISLKSSLKVGLPASTNKDIEYQLNLNFR